MDRRLPHGLQESKNGAIMTAEVVRLEVAARVPKNCTFCLEDDRWNGVCEELSVSVLGSSFEDAKRKMEAALQAHIEGVLREHLTGKRAA